MKVSREKAEQDFIRIYGVEPTVATLQQFIESYPRKTMGFPKIKITGKDWSKFLGRSNGEFVKAFENEKTEEKLKKSIKYFSNFKTIFESRDKSREPSNQRKEIIDIGIRDLKLGYLEIAKAINRIMGYNRINASTIRFVHLKKKR